MPPSKLFLKNRLTAGLALLLAVYLLVCIYMYAQQGRLMYHPQQHTVPALLTVMSDLPAGSMLDTERHAIVAEPPQVSRGTVIFFHGNSGHAWKYLPYYRHFHTLGYRLVLAEYPGFGWRDGQPNEAHIVRDALALYTHWRERTPSPQPVIVLGKSLGTGVAIQVAAQASVPPSKLVLLTPFRSITEVAASKYWMLPVGLLLKDTFASDQYLPRYTGPVSMLIAGRDDVVGASTGLQLLELARQRGPTQLMMKADDDHNSWMPLLTTPEWQQLLH